MERLAENAVDTVVMNDDESTQAVEEDYASNRRSIRSHYREIVNLIAEEKDELATATSKKFLAILNEVDNIHKHVTKPREQVSDAEALLGLASTLTASMKSHTIGGVTPAEFISCMIKQFAKRTSMEGLSKVGPNILWQYIGSFVSPFLMEAPCCMTMIGPMKNEVKIRKQVSRVRRTRPVGNARPEEVEKAAGVVSDTDKNLCVMFKILKEKEKKAVKVKLENLILNRNCFAQTVENLFALSFLVKDGRVVINVDEDGSQVVVPTNGPSSEQMKKGDVKDHQFIFRFDFDDWKQMKNLVNEGEELMPHRDAYTTTGHSQAKAGSKDEGINKPGAIPINCQMMNTIPVKKFSKNYGHVVNSCSDLTGVDNATVDSLKNWNCKRKRSVL